MRMGLKADIVVKTSSPLHANKFVDAGEDTLFPIIDEIWECMFPE